MDKNRNVYKTVSRQSETRDRIAKILLRTKGNSDEFTKTMETIRNKIGFHFTEYPKVSSLDKDGLHGLSQIMQSSTGDNYHSVFTISDQVIVSNIFPKDTNKEFGGTLEKLSEEVNSIFSLVNDILIEIVDGTVQFEN